jgi:uncharacterized membrane protein
MDNTFVRELPADPERSNSLRQVGAITLQQQQVLVVGVSLQLHPLLLQQAYWVWTDGHGWHVGWWYIQQRGTVCTMGGHPADTWLAAAESCSTKHKACHQNYSSISILHQ